MSATPSSFAQGAAQPNPVELQFAGRVHYVSVRGQGAILCSGNYGELVAYAEDGSEIGRAALSLVDPADCSTAANPDNVTFGARAELTTTQPVARAVITPMTPLDFPVFDQVGHASATYDVGYGEGRPPVLSLEADFEETGPGENVTFTAALTPSGGSRTLYTVERWLWTPDPVEVSWPPFASRPRSSAGSRPLYSFTDDFGRQVDPDSALAESDQVELTPDRFAFTFDPFPPSLPRTAPCTTPDLTCVIPVNESGKMTAVVRVGSERLTATVAVQARYFCPELWPGRPTGVFVTPKAAILRSRQGDGYVYIDDEPGWVEPVEFLPPWKRLEPEVRIPGSPVPRSNYAAHDIVRSNPQSPYRDLLMDVDHSYVQMQCLVRRVKEKNKPAILRGELQPISQYKILLTRTP